MKKLRRWWRRREAFDKMFYGLMVILIIMLVCTSLAKGDVDKQYIEVVNPPGKYLWHYWEEYGKGERYDKWLYETMELNGMDTAEVFEGQILRVEVRE